MLEQIAPLSHAPTTKGGTITKAAVEVAQTLGAKYLVAFTQSGDSARRMSRLRSRIPILALTPEISVYNQLALSWGVESMITPAAGATDEMVKLVDGILVESGRVERGNSVVIVAGSPPGIPGSTNALRLHIVGDAIDGVAAAYRR
jgi:pyruvate kinase